MKKTNKTNKKSKDISIKQSMDDVTKDKIVFVDTEGNTLGEYERKPKKNKSEEKKQKKSRKIEEERIPERPNHVTRRKLSLKEKRKRKRRAIALLITEWVLGLAIVIIGAILFVLFACGLKNVVVEGSYIYSDEEIKEYVIDGKYSNNTVYEVIHNFIKPKKDIPFIDNVKVTMTGLNTVKITVTERTPIGYVETDCARYFDEDGKITDISDRILDNSTKWNDIEPTGTEIGDTIYNDEAYLNAFLETVKELKANNIFVNSITVDDNHNIYGYKDNIKINFGLKNDMDEKCKRLAIILPQLENQAGTLHLENFSLENTDIVFKKEVQ